MASIKNTGSSESSVESSHSIRINPVEQFEEAFQNCLSALTKEDTLTNVDKDEIRVDVEEGLTNFMEKARTMESYFLKKRLEIASQKPELLIRDELNELKMESMRKDELLKKNHEKIAHWQAILSDVQPGRSNQIPGGNGLPMGPMSQEGPHSQSPMTPGPPMTPTGGRPNTPGGPLTPGMGGGGQRMQMQNVYSPSMHQQSMGSPQIGGGGMSGQGLQGPLAYLERSASGIGMGQMGDNQR